jgi:hypothetical protein
VSQGFCPQCEHVFDRLNDRRRFCSDPCEDAYRRNGQQRRLALVMKRIEILTAKRDEILNEINQGEKHELAASNR